ncbi:MAG: hypothetical protein ACE5I9_10005 [Candidatus Methylomirabilales bacterium]
MKQLIAAKKKLLKAKRELDKAEAAIAKAEAKLRQLKRILDFIFKALVFSDLPGSPPGIKAERARLWREWRRWSKSLPASMGTLKKEMDEAFKSHLRALQNFLKNYNRIKNQVKKAESDLKKMKAALPAKKAAYKRARTTLERHVKRLLKVSAMPMLSRWQHIVYRRFIISVCERGASTELIQKLLHPSVNPTRTQFVIKTKPPVKPRSISGLPRRLLRQLAISGRRLELSRTRSILFIMFRKRSVLVLVFNVRGKLFQQRFYR